MDNPPSTPGSDAICAWLRDYAARRLDLDLSDERRSIPPHVVQDFARLGLFGLNGEQEFGALPVRLFACERATGRD